MPVNLTGINLNVDESYFNLSVNGEILDLNYRKDVVYGTTRQIEEVAFEDSDLVFVGYGVDASRERHQLHNRQILDHYLQRLLLLFVS